MSSSNLYVYTSHLLDVKGKVHPGERFHHQMVVHSSGALYLYGGMDENNNFLNSLYRLTPDREWEEVKPVNEDVKEDSTPPPRYCHALCLRDHSLHQKLYIYGGYTDGQGPVRLNDLWEYDLIRHEWSKVKFSAKVAPPPLTSHSLSYHKPSDSLILFGGSDGTKYSNDVYQFTLSNNKWRKLKPKNNMVPVGRYGHTAVWNGNDMIVFGGGTVNSLNLNDTLSFSVKSRAWKEIKATGEKPKPRNRHGACVLDGSMFIFGGAHTQSIMLNDLWMLNLANSVWQRIEIAGDIPTFRNGLALNVLPSEKAIVLYGGDDGQRLLGDFYHILPPGVELKPIKKKEEPLIENEPMPMPVVHATPKQGSQYSPNSSFSSTHSTSNMNTHESEPGITSINSNYQASKDYLQKQYNGNSFSGQSTSFSTQPPHSGQASVRSLPSNVSNEQSAPIVHDTPRNDNMSPHQDNTLTPRIEPQNVPSPIYTNSPSTLVMMSSPQFNEPKSQEQLQDVNYGSNMQSGQNNLSSPGGQNNFSSPSNNSIDLPPSNISADVESLVQRVQDLERQVHVLSQTNQTLTQTVQTLTQKNFLFQQKLQKQAQIITAIQPLSITQQKQLFIYNKKWLITSEKIQSIDWKNPHHGAYSNVYRGVYNEEEVAVKRIDMERVSELHDCSFETVKDIVLNEVFYMIKVNSQHVVKPFGVCFEDRYAMVVMEWCSTDLGNYIRNNQLSIGAKVRMLVQISQAMSAIHHEGILHRDLKPRNILIQDNGIVKIIDFGISDNDSSSSARARKNIQNSFIYVAPELYIDMKPGSGKEDPYTKVGDIYAFGMIAYFILTGAEPMKEHFAPFSAYPHKFLNHVLKENIRPDYNHEMLQPHNCPPLLVELIEKCSDHDPEKRLQSFDDIVTMLTTPQN